MFEPKSVGCCHHKDGDWKEKSIVEFGPTRAFVNFYKPKRFEITMKCDVEITDKPIVLCIQWKLGWGDNVKYGEIVLNDGYNFEIFNNSFQKCYDKIKEYVGNYFRAIDMHIAVMNCVYKAIEILKKREQVKMGFENLTGLTTEIFKNKNEIKEHLVEMKKRIEELKTLVW